MTVDRNLLTQTFAGIIIIVLLVTFYILLITDITRGAQTLLTPMVLIIISIILVAIFSVLYTMETKIENTERPSQQKSSKKR